VVTAYMPAYDGDLAELDDLAFRVLDAVQDRRWVPATAQLEFGDCAVYWTAFAVAGCNEITQRIWPDDRAAELLAVWRAQLDGIAA
jgi:hypothetical protein